MLRGIVALTLIWSLQWEVPNPEPFWYMTQGVLHCPGAVETNVLTDMSSTYSNIVYTCKWDCFKGKKTLLIVVYDLFPIFNLNRWQFRVYERPCPQKKPVLPWMP